MIIYNTQVADIEDENYIKENQSEFFINNSVPIEPLPYLLRAKRSLFSGRPGRPGSPFSGNGTIDFSFLFYDLFTEGRNWPCDMCVGFGM